MHRQPITTLFPYTTLFRSTTCNCNGSEWGDLMMNAQGTPPQVLACGNTYNVKCSTTYTINAGFMCADPHCPATVQYKLKRPDRKSTRLNSSHLVISYAVFC